MLTINQACEYANKKKEGLGRDSFTTVNLANAYIAGGIEALSTQWRSVKDALPEDNRMVMVHISDINIIPDLSYCMAYYENGVWDFPDDYYFHCDVTHWMPIPKLNNEKR